MKNIDTAVSAVILALILALPVIAKERMVSERIKYLAARSKMQCPESGREKEVPYCYLFKAIVDIDDGYLRVWKSDSEGNSYVAAKLFKGDIVYVRQVFVYRGVQRAQLMLLTDGCMSQSCSGSIDLRYLR
jgi:hypothetical protein